ncbi:hypothetical protein C8T65DRAFT_697889 [Cerioporus squamosus]|nr:hypothetical protein C8T65DRAFT_697889 [Cerioporus squamosus]
MASENDTPGLNGKHAARAPPREASLDESEVPVASFGGETALAGAIGDPPDLATFSQTQESIILPLSPSPSQLLLENRDAIVADDLRRNGRDIEQLPPSSGPGSFTESQEEHPPLAQQRVNWMDIDFANLHLPPPPSVTYRSTSMSTASVPSIPSPSPAGRKPNVQPMQHRTEPFGVQEQPRPTSPGVWSVHSLPQKRGRDPSSQAAGSGRERRRRVNPADMRNIGVGTKERMRPYLGKFNALPNPFSIPRPPPAEGPSAEFTFSSPAPSSSRPQPLVRSPRLLPQSHVNDADYASLNVTGPAAELQEPASAGAPAASNMVVDYAPQLQQNQPETHCESGPLGNVAGQLQDSDSRPSLDLPLQATGPEDPFVLHFNNPTPRQAHDSFARRPVQLPSREPQRPPIAGPYVVRNVQRQATPGPSGASSRLPPFAELEKSVMDRRDPPARQPLADVTPREETGHGVQNANQENVPPAPVRPQGMLRGATAVTDRSVVGLSRASRPAAFQLATPNPDVPRPRSVFVPPAGVSQNYMYGPPGHPIAAISPQLAMQPEMRPPREGYPRVCFDDHYSLAMGSDEEWVRRIDAVDDNPLAIRIPLVNGLPPDRTMRSIMERLYDSIREATGEEEFWIIPPRPARAAPPGVHAIMWVIRGLSDRAADDMVERRVISSPLITFFIFPFTVEPRVVLILSGFASNVGGQIEAMIRETFHGQDVRSILTQHVVASPMFEEYDPSDAVRYLLETLEIDVSVMANRTINARVYINFPGVEPTTWRFLRAAVAAVAFEDGYNAPATPTTYRCDVCSGNDHPTEMCRYPALSGWLGPVPQVERSTSPPPLPGSALIFRPREQKETRGGAPRRGKARPPFFQPGDGPPFSNGAGRGGGRGGAGSGGSMGLRAF